MTPVDAAPTRRHDPADLVDLPTLQQWLDDRQVGSGPLTDLSLITGGTQNILLRFRRSGDELVMRRPPLHKRATSDQTMIREATVLAGLAGSNVPHPRLVATCADTTPLGYAFFIMESVDGFNPRVELPARFAADPDLQQAMGLSVVDALSAIGRVDANALGLWRLGKADGWLERQVSRWTQQLESYAEFDGWGGPDLPGLDEVASWLDEHRPMTWQPGLIHGDFHLANILFAIDEARVAAVVDWELATIGDPLLDLGHLLATWPNDHDSRRSPLPVPMPGLPQRDAIIARYAELSGRDLSSIDWYQVLACYRLAILLEGSNARASMGKAPREVGDRLHAIARGLVTQAVELIVETTSSTTDT